jgi:myxalamid-type polyketide synthase MxaE and MxaD/epothilone polyketide synthase D
MRVFCLPYAGGNVAIYKQWRAETPGDVRFYALELPGRGARLTEPPLTDLGALARTLAAEMHTIFAERPFALFGHSLGGLIGAQLSIELRRYGVAPDHLYLSAISCPGRDTVTHWHRLTDEALLDEVRRAGGTPRKMLDKKAFTALLLPVLRADLQMLDLPSFDHALTVPVTTFSGARDLFAPPLSVLNWCRHAAAGFMHLEFDDSHFFLRNRRAEIMATILHNAGARMHAADAGPLPA